MLPCTDMFCRKINYTLLSWSASIRKTVTCTMQKMFTHSPQSSQCFPNTVETTLHKKITGAILVQSAQIYFLGKIGYFKYVSWPVFNWVRHHQTILPLFVQFWLGSSFTARGTTMNRARHWLEHLNKNTDRLFFR